MAYAYKQDDKWVEFAGSPLINGDRYPENWCDLASPQMRTARGIKAIAEPAAPSSDQRVTGSRLVGDANPQREWITEPMSLSEFKAQRKAFAESERKRLILQAAESAMGAAFNARLQAIKATIDGASTLQAVQNINLTTGYPT